MQAIVMVNWLRGMHEPCQLTRSRAPGVQRMNSRLSAGFPAPASGCAAARRGGVSGEVAHIVRPGAERVNGPAGKPTRSALSGRAVVSLGASRCRFFRSRLSGRLVCA
ncbi:hypothetical protein Bphy_5334 [Paraburkholderia phymatum STM815]|uniref:Uncharacterized protein n=1 Tax=Paraburkholderia phymatum (strain DSM 17167 / CIP 108236 / LMG 21445 / STM815) TaxID=391038 RepID=B2JNB0_PARP8|nr:hypothetical protein Bphy_5334 [Paraburkholderia phymatum STM815]